MKLLDDIDELRAEISKIVDTVEEINTSVESIPSTSQKDLTSKFSNLMTELDSASNQLETAKYLLKIISIRWNG